MDLTINPRAVPATAGYYALDGHYEASTQHGRGDAKAKKQVEPNYRANPNRAHRGCFPIVARRGTSELRLDIRRGAPWLWLQVKVVVSSQGGKHENHH